MKRTKIMPISNDGDQHTLAFECVWSGKRMREFYVLLNGQRIAERSRNQDGEPVWMPLVKGYRVVDTPDLDGIAIFFGDGELQ